MRAYLNLLKALILMNYDIIAHFHDIFVQNHTIYNLKMQLNAIIYTYTCIVYQIMTSQLVTTYSIYQRVISWLDIDAFRKKLCCASWCNLIIPALHCWPYKERYIITLGLFIDGNESRLPIMLDYWSQSYTHTWYIICLWCL